MTTIRLTLYIIGKSALSKKAIKNFRTLCAEPEFNQLYDACEVEIIDLLKNPEVVEKEGIFATPLLVKNDPAPKLRIVGDLSNKQKVLAILGIIENGHGE